MFIRVITVTFLFLTHILIGLALFKVVLLASKKFLNALIVAVQIVFSRHYPDHNSEKFKTTNIKFKTTF